MVEKAGTAGTQVQAGMQACGGGGKAGQRQKGKAVLVFPSTHAQCPPTRDRVCPRHAERSHRQLKVCKRGKGKVVCKGRSHGVAGEEAQSLQETSPVHSGEKRCHAAMLYMSLRQKWREER